MSADFDLEFYDFNSSSVNDVLEFAKKLTDSYESPSDYDERKEHRLWSVVAALKEVEPEFEVFLPDHKAIAAMKGRRVEEATGGERGAEMYNSHCEIHLWYECVILAFGLENDPTLAKQALSRIRNYACTISQATEFVCYFAQANRLVDPGCDWQEVENHCMPKKKWLSWF